MSKKLTEARLRRIVTVWCERLALTNWVVNVDFAEPALEEADATTWRSNSYDRATIRLAPEWRVWSVITANRLIVHELLHLITRDIDRVFASVEPEIGTQAWKLLDDRYDHEIEGLVDRLAVRLVNIAGCV